MRAALPHWSHRRVVSRRSGRTSFRYPRCELRDLALNFLCRLPTCHLECLLAVALLEPPPQSGQVGRRVACLRTRNSPATNGGLHDAKVRLVLARSGFLRLFRLHSALGGRLGRDQRVLRALRLFDLVVAGPGSRLGGTLDLAAAAAGQQDLRRRGTLSHEIHRRVVRAWSGHSVLCAQWAAARGQ